VTRSALFFGKIGDILLRLILATVGTFFLFVLFAMLHSLFGNKLKSSVEEKEKKAVQAELIRKQPSKKRDAVRQMRQMKSASSGKEAAGRS